MQNLDYSIEWELRAQTSAQTLDLLQKGFHENVAFLCNGTARLGLEHIL